MLPLQVLTCSAYSQPIAKAWLTTPAYVHSVIKFVGFDHGMRISIYCKFTQLSNIRPGTEVISIRCDVLRKTLSS